jgi:16S rRNA (uracil1498-N3)-methyltransferase
VLRVEPGQRFEISDNRSLYLAEVEVARKNQVLFRTIERLPPRPLPLRLTLFVSLIKFDRFEWMLEKATELGAGGIIPVIAERCEKGLDRAAEKRVERWRKIVLESSQQSRRTELPAVETPVEFARALELAVPLRYVLDEQPDGKPLLAGLPERREAADEVALLVGPEGGWTDGERARAVAAGWQAASLGNRVLRAETAAIAGLAAIVAAWEGGGTGPHAVD